MPLSEQLNKQSLKSNIAADCAALIDEQVSSKGGVSGIALKTSYKIVKGLKADYIPRAIHNLLPEVLSALDPMWDEGVQLGDPVAYLSSNSDRTADTILGVTDAKIERTTNKPIRSAYDKLRKSVKGDISAAVPSLAQILGKYAAN